MLAFLTSKLGLAGIALALVLGVIGIQTLRLHHAQAEATQARADLATCQASVRTQNAAIAAQSARSKAALEAAAKTQAAVAPLAQHHAAKALALSIYKPKGSSQCEMLEDAVREARESFR